ncbi:hypothetical protein HDA36_003469 [Nocardiopsis composta]|uniref:Uncharacterized protein n=1 Tax=Nocardiopsis composta TaxID=157465 RepID=A0A7W8QN46_9ACTN|nr:hypothetical protein [Nocardiopsis composta]
MPGRSRKAPPRRTGGGPPHPDEAEAPGPPGDRRAGPRPAGHSCPVSLEVGGDPRGLTRPGRSSQPSRSIRAVTGGPVETCANTVPGTGSRASAAPPPPADRSDRPGHRAKPHGRSENRTGRVRRDNSTGLRPRSGDASAQGSAGPLPGPPSPTPRPLRKAAAGRGPCRRHGAPAASGDRRACGRGPGGSAGGRPRFPTAPSRPALPHRKAVTGRPVVPARAGGPGLLPRSRYRPAAVGRAKRPGAPERIPGDLSEGLCRLAVSGRRAVPDPVRFSADLDAAVAAAGGIAGVGGSGWCVAPLPR